MMIITIVSGHLARPMSRGGGEVGMIETYFAIRLYVLYAMIVALGICGITLLVILIKDRFNRR